MHFPPLSDIPALRLALVGTGEAIAAAIFSHWLCDSGVIYRCFLQRFRRRLPKQCPVIGRKSSELRKMIAKCNLRDGRSSWIGTAELGAHQIQSTQQDISAGA